MLTATRSVFTGMFRRFGVGSVVGALLVVGASAAAFAYWTTLGTGGGSAAAATLNPPTSVLLAVDNSTVTVSFTGTTAPAGSLTGYYVQRNDGSSTANACGTTPGNSASYLSASAITCVDNSVPNATYTYTVTAVFRTWSATSAPSASLLVNGDTHAPTQVLTVSSSNAFKSGSLIYFRSASAGSLTISSAVTDDKSGPASAAFPAVDGFGWTHAAETISSGSGANPKTYTSSTFSWNAGSAAPSQYTVTARDVVGNSSDSSVTFAADNAAPTGGALTANSVVASNAGGLGTSTTGTYSIGSETDFTDAASGMASTVLSREVGTLSGGTCSAYAAASVISRAVGALETSAATGCYRYTLVGTDNVGNASSISLVIKVDRAAPTQTFSATSANASVTGTTLYYKGDIIGGGSTTLTAAVTDAASGPASAAFPAIGTTGWTHAAETVTAGSGSSPTSYTSSAFTWTASPSNPTGYSVTGSDVAGNTLATGLTFVSDTTIPVTGALTVNSTGATVLGTTSSSAGTFSGSFTNFTDAGAGIATSVLTRETGTFSNGNCVLYGTPVVIASISESGLSGGCYRYTLTGTDKVGNTTSLTTTVTIDPTAPTQTFSETGANSYVNGTTLYYKSNAVGSFTISAAVTDNESGPKQSVFPLISTTGWTHAAETVTASTGSNPTKTFTSSPYSWTANPTNPTNTAARTVTSSDIAGNPVATALTFTPDSTAPTGGYVTVNGDNGSTGGTTGYGSSNFTGTITDFTDAGSGIASQTLTRATATLSGSTCGTFGQTTTISSISETSATNCYRYVLTATDNVGNVATSTTLTVQVDTTAPTVSITENGTNSFKTGSTIYYRGDLASSTILSAAVTDAASGAASATFPDINTTGWTHLAETVSSGSGSNPITYASSNFSWTANPSNPATYTVTGTDGAGNTGTSSVSFASDTTAPTGGALTANTTSGTAAGAWSIASSASPGWSVSKTNFSDAASGIATNVLEREESVDGTCTSWNAATTANSFTETTGRNGSVSQDFCYRYTLTGTDNVGNVSTLQVTVAYADQTGPTQDWSLSTSSNAVLSGTRIYYRSDRAGSFKLAAAVTDAASGPKSVAFPAISGTGWTHASETVTASTGTRPTLTYTSSTYSWTAGASNPSSQSITATDNANNAATGTLNFTADVTAPTGGSITINGTASSNGGTTAYSNGTFSATPTNFTDAGVGMGTNAITEATATLSGSTCGTFGSATTVLAIGRTGAAPGCYKYVLTGSDLLGNSTSTTITVQVEQGVPAQTVSVNSGNAFLSGSTLYYRSGVSGVFTLASAVTDDFPGPASALFPAVVGATGWTHATQTVTSGTGTNPISYISSNFTLAAGATNPGTYTVTGADKAGNTVDTTLTTVADASAPTGGALTVASTPGTALGATVVRNSGLFSGTYTDYSADAGSGLASSVLVRETAPLSGGVCGAFTGASTITSISESALSSGCYRYTLTGTDNVGNTSVLSAIVQVDVTAPTVVVTENGANSYLNGSTLYYRGDPTSSLTLSAAVTDANSGAASASFPDVATTGWTHNAETISSAASTSGTTKTYNSSTFTWTASPSNPGSYTVTGTDAAGNTGTSAVSFTSDTTGPTGGTLTVDGVGVTSGSTIAGANASYNVTKTNFSADAGSGYASTANITREYATLSGATCGTFGNSSTASSFTEVSGGGSATLSSGRCYRYTMTGTDNVGNTTTIQRTIYFETTNPTQALTLATSSNAVLSGTTLYYRSNLAGSFTIADAVTDSGSGADSANFPLINTLGWTHNAETVTSGTGTNPKTFTSTAYSWTSGASNPTSKTITGYDFSGNSVTTSLSFTADNTAPTSGVLTVNGTGGSAGGSTSYTNTTFSGTKTNFTDAGVGIDTNVLTREFATITNGVCDSFGSATVITSISETTPAVGCYRYTLTATDLLANATSLSTTVMVDTTAPSSVVVSESGADAYLSGSTLYFRSGISSSLTLSAAVTDAFPGAASATFPAISTTNWTHGAETVTSGTGSNPITYTSSSFSWTSAAVAPSGTRTISGADKAGNSTNATPISFVADGSGPTGGALTVAGTSGTSGGATVATNSALFSGSYTDYSADAGSGVASSVLVRETATLTSGACGTFGNSSTITSISETALATGCYRYTLTGTDNVGNTSVLRTIVQVDVTAPTVVLTQTPTGTNSLLTGSTLYYRGDLATSLTLNAAVTDAASGAASASFPAIATTGWTHNAETISSAASTSGTTKTYNSTNFSWTASPSNPGSYTVTGTDAAGNAGTSAVTFTSDITGPTGGSLTVGGTTLTSNGSSLTASVAGTNAAYNVSKTNFSADAGSGYASTSNITRDYATLTSGVCGTFGNSSTSSSFVETTTGGTPTLTSGRCYRYTVAGTDNVGNTTTIQRTIYFETTNPTQALTLATSSNAVLSGTTLYYRSNLNGSFTVADAVTDGGSGPDSANFPVVSTIGWTHADETVTSGSGNNPKTFTSANYSWTSGASNPTNTTISGYDFSGNTVATSLSFTVDNTPPAAAGSLTVNNVGGLVAGSTSYTNTTFSGSKTDFTDAGVGISTNVLTRQFATITNGVCDSFGSATVITSISETTPAVGCYRYTLTATDLLANATSLSTTVMVDTTAPSSVVVSESGDSTYLSGSTLYFRSGSVSALTLSAAVTDAFPGAASAKFPAGPTNWTHSNENVISGTGTNPVTYISTPFTSTATASSSYTVTGADKAGNTTDSVLALTPDAAGPTGGALSVAGTNGTSSGATIVSTSGLFSGTYTDYSADAGSGLASSALVKDTAPLSGGVCGAFTGASTITSISESALSSGCYRYTLTGTDNVGNTSVLSAIVQVDVTAPTVVVTENGANSYLNGSTLYYRGDPTSSLTLSAAVTDANSGAASASFPDVATTGWTHNAEIISSGTGSNPKTYTSSNFVWSANPSSPGSYTVTGTDAAGNTGTSAVTFTSDTTGPTGGSLTAAGTSATSSGALTTASGAYTVSRTAFSTDAGSGLALTSSGLISREVSTTGACTAWNGATTAASWSETAGGTLTADRCYRYTLTGIDNVGNTSVLKITVAYLDATVPTQTLTAASATNAVVSATTIFYKSNSSGSVTLADAVTDGASGPQKVTFPAIGTTGWTHNAETVTASTGVLPTKTYTSSAYTWTANPTNPTTAANRTITAFDTANNSGAVTLTFTPDVTAPTGGSITVNNTASLTGAGSTAYAPNTFTGSVVNFSDAGVGMDTNVITRATATLTGTTCGTFGTAAVVPTISESGSGGCFQYVLTGTDLLGNAATSTVTVKVDDSAPTMVVTSTGTNTSRQGAVTYYKSNTSGSLTLSAAVTDVNQGPASATFPDISTNGWTHPAQTVSSGTVSGTTTTYDSSTFTWTANPSAPSTYTVTGRDLAGNTTAAGWTFSPDAAGPTGAALTVAGTSITGSGTSVYNKTGTFSGSFIQYSADAASGLLSSAITKDTATLLNGVCGSYSAGTAPTGGTISEASLANGCYRYTLTGTDNVGNTSTLSVVVVVDKTAPTQTISASGSNAFVSGSTLYYKGNAAGSTTLSSVLADTGSCGLSMRFPSLSGTSTGFTFTTNTDSSPSGACPSQTFSSANALTWTNPTSSSPTMAIVGSDNAGNTVTTTLTLTNDVTAPASAGLSANGVTATSGGATTTIYSGSSTSLSVTNGSDAGSGINHLFTVDIGTNSGGNCNGYGGATTISTSLTTYSVSSGNCYRFILTPTDNVGNTGTALSVVVKR